jgi:hypothetical protein
MKIDYSFDHLLVELDEEELDEGITTGMRVNLKAMTSYDSH